MDVAGIVLAGGRSSRMGVSKATIEWHRSTMLHRICGVIARVVEGPIVVVAAPGQDLPHLPRGVEVIQDPQEGRGPLQGIATGLTAVADRVPSAYVSATDVPFLHPAFVRHVVAALAPGAEVALPRVGGVEQPLAAAYATSVGAKAQQLVDANRLRVMALTQRCMVKALDERVLLADEELAAADPELQSIFSLDDMYEFERARARPGPRVTIERLGTLRRDVDLGPRPVRTATLGGAAQAAGLELGEAVTAAVGGVLVWGAGAWSDPELPLVDGDEVTFAAAAAAESAA